jgi:hypothetical protein
LVSPPTELLFESGGYGKIVALPRIKATFDALLNDRGNHRERNAARRVHRAMFRWSQNGPGELIVQGTLRNEGKFKCDANSTALVVVWAFKADLLRVYGVTEGTAAHDRCFYCTEIEPGKQRNKADQEKLKRAAIKYGELKK